MQKRLLVTGGTGFIGRNIIPVLSETYQILSPNRRELNLFNEDDVREYIAKHKIDVILHFANPCPSRNLFDKQERMLEDSMRIFLSVYQSRDMVERIFFLGSGAEYDKSKDISNISEDMEERSIPYDSYGIAKYIQTQLCKASNNIFNLRIFGCYGPTDHESKFITHAIRCCLRHEDITIRQDCLFDYMQVTDLANILQLLISRKLSCHTYNICTGTAVSLYEIAEEVRKQMGTCNKIVVLKNGMNKEYTGNNERLKSVIGEYSFIDIKDGISMQIEYEKSVWM